MDILTPILASFEKEQKSLFPKDFLYFWTWKYEIHNNKAEKNNKRYFVFCILVLGPLSFHRMDEL